MQDVQFSRYKVTDRETGQEIQCCFVLRPDVDSAARVSMAAYAEATQNKTMARLIGLWLASIHRKKSLKAFHEKKMNVYASRVLPGGGGQ